MKKFCTALYFVLMAVLTIATLHSSCGSNGGSVSGDTSTKSSQAKRMAITSSAFKRNGSYNIYRGSTVSVIGTSAKYYVTPENHGTEKLTMNLEYQSAVSEDLPIVITDSDDSTVIFSYIPSNSGTDTESTGVLRLGGTADKMKYTSLTLSTASFSDSSARVDSNDEGIIDIVLNSDGTATVGNTVITANDYVWHADPQHPEQYWTNGINGSTVYYEDAYENSIVSTFNSAEGVYIARDVRYTPNTLTFTTSQTATKDEDTEYVVYYDLTASALQDALTDLSNDYGADYGTAKYIFATLPMTVGGGMPGDGGTPPDGGQGGTPPDGGQGGTPPNAPGGFSASATDTSAIPATATMTHSASDAYKNPVLHITEPGTYRLSGKWHGQIWVEAGAKEKHKIGLILNGVEVSCDVAPAIVFYKVYKWAENTSFDTQSVLAANDTWKTLDEKMVDDEGYYKLGAVVEIADGTTNTFTGANVYRILELCPKLDDDTGEPKYAASKIGSDISAQEKMYKLDGAFHSRRSIVIGGGDEGTGKLNITSTTCEGLDSEMHMLISGGNITINAPDDGINVNEDYVSVFEMTDGTLKITSTGGDGIDSNGWVSIQGGTLDITAGETRIAQAEGGIDYINGYYIYDDSAYTWTKGGTNVDPNNGSSESDTSTDDDTDSNTTTTLPVTETTVEIGSSTSFTLFPESFEADTEGARNIPSTGETFPLVHRVNDFAGITAK
ncbi:MAG: carbohydrate-binding domain-containing protein [Synergistaceae bacterium]|nr:carbohydrate-binding domain-containing protein [Synergistaceae bacterium]